MILRERPTLLDRRDVEILRMLSEGMLEERIAADLHVSLRTLQRRVAVIKDRLGAASTIAAVVTAIRRGLI